MQSFFLLISLKLVLQFKKAHNLIPTNKFVTFPYKQFSTNSYNFAFSFVFQTIYFSTGTQSSSVRINVIDRMTEGATAIACLDDTINIHQLGQDEEIEMPVMRSPAEATASKKQVWTNVFIKFCLDSMYSFMEAMNWENINFWSCIKPVLVAM